jgi:hypothetical protein
VAQFQFAKVITNISTVRNGFAGKELGDIVLILLKCRQKMAQQGCYGQRELKSACEGCEI